MPSYRFEFEEYTGEIPKPQRDRERGLAFRKALDKLEIKQKITKIIIDGEIVSLNSDWCSTARVLATRVSQKANKKFCITRLANNTFMVLRVK